jgi:hypothetical protein
MNSHASHAKYSKRDLSHEGFQATQRRTMVHLFMMRFTCQLRSRGSGIFDNTARPFEPFVAPLGERAPLAFPFQPWAPVICPFTLDLAGLRETGTAIVEARPGPFWAIELPLATLAMPPRCKQSNSSYSPPGIVPLLLFIPISSHNLHTSGWRL